MQKPHSLMCAPLNTKCALNMEMSLITTEAMKSVIKDKGSIPSALHNCACSGSTFGKPRLGFVIFCTKFSSSLFKTQPQTCLPDPFGCLLGALAASLRATLSLLCSLAKTVVKMFKPTASFVLFTSSLFSETERNTGCDYVCCASSTKWTTVVMESPAH